MKKILLSCGLCLVSAFCFAMQDYEKKPAKKSEKKSDCTLNYDAYKGKQPSTKAKITHDKKKKNTSSN